MTEPLKIAILEGDETGQELLEQAVRVLARDVIGVVLELVPFDLSLENRRATANGVVDEAARPRSEAGPGHDAQVGEDLQRSTARQVGIELHAP